MGNWDVYQKGEGLATQFIVDGNKLVSFCLPDREKAFALAALLNLLDQPHHGFSLRYDETITDDMVKLT